MVIAVELIVVISQNQMFHLEFLFSKLPRYFIESTKDLQNLFFQDGEVYTGRIGEGVLGVV